MCKPHQMQSINNKQFCYGDYQFVKFIESGSFATCVLANHLKHGECAMLVSKDRKEFENRLAFHQKYQHLHGISLVYELFEMNIS